MIGMPFCALTASDVASFLASSASARRIMAAARRSVPQEAQPVGASNAARAAPTARSMSSREPSGTAPR